MATSTEGIINREVLVERAPILGGAIVAAAGLVVGVASFVNGATTGFEVRLPIYVLAGAVVFVGALLTMRHSRQDGMTVLRRATLAGFLGAAVVSLGSEAIVYGLIVVAPELSLYLLSAVVVSCGLVYWSIRNWRAVENLTRPW